MSGRALSSDSPAWARPVAAEADREAEAQVSERWLIHSAQQGLARHWQGIRTQYQEVQASNPTLGGLSDLAPAPGPLFPSEP